MSNGIAGKMPLHIQISEMLAREIRAGILLDGSRLAPEREMASDLHISVGTLRKALADLTQKGLLERIQGSGNYVRNSSQAQTIYGFFRLELLGGGGLPTAQTFNVERMTKPSDLPDFGQSDEAFRIRRLRLLNQQNAALEEIWLDGSVAQSITLDDLSDSLYQFYKQELSLRIIRAQDMVSVAPPPQWKPANFISKADNWGYIERLSFCQNNTCVEYSRSWFDPINVRFVARWS